MKVAPFHYNENTCTTMKWSSLYKESLYSNVTLQDQRLLRFNRTSRIRHEWRRTTVL